MTAQHSENGDTLETTLELGALVPHGKIRVEGARGGPLAGLTFAAKDLFDVAGHGTSAGNPDWLKTHAPPKTNAWAVQALLDAGATLTGKTITDELAFGLTGRNFHYGAPINAAAPDRITGGSSSGSASAVSGKAVNFALGSDTGGSVRIPAS
jgi:amidase